jgi:hypothetical protein
MFRREQLNVNELREITTFRNHLVTQTIISIFVASQTEMVFRCSLMLNTRRNNIIIHEFCLLSENVCRWVGLWSSYNSTSKLILYQKVDSSISHCFLLFHFCEVINTILYCQRNEQKCRWIHRHGVVHLWRKHKERLMKTWKLEEIELAEQSSSHY